MMQNAKIMNVTLTWRQMCDLRTACTAARYAANDGGEKWAELRKVLIAEMDKFQKQDSTENG